MMIRSDEVLAKIEAAARRGSRDRSHHLLCPSCGIRTKLHSLSDGRKKCSKCGKKFTPRKKAEEIRLRQYADLLLCFCFDFPARRASAITGYRYRLVMAAYDRFRSLLAGQNLVPGKIKLLTATESTDRCVHDSAFCRRCRSRFRCGGRKSGDAPVFGIKFLGDGKIFIDPLSDAEASSRFGAASGASGYAGFVCRGKFHRFEGDARSRDGAEQLWAWMRDRLRPHHGIWRRNAGLYLKELEWKYNNRLLEPETKALKLAELLPRDFLAIPVRKAA